MNFRDVLIGVAVASALCIPSSVVIGDGFTNPSNWMTYDFPDDNSTDGFVGVCYDDVHECIYYAPYVGSTAVTRYCKPGSSSGFNDPNQWASCDVGSLIGAQGGYQGAAFDGRYVYFAPFTIVPSSCYGDVLRHDTAGPFCDASSWATFDLQANAGQISGADHPGGFNGAFYADGFVYFPSFRRCDIQPYGASGELVRYNTACEFSNPACWEAFDYSQSAACLNDPECHGLGYGEPCFDGRYVYFSPGARDGVFHGETLRYDTLGDFLDETSWAMFDFSKNCTPGENCTNPVGYDGCVVDADGIIYFSPGHSPYPTGGEVLRYDSGQPFTDPASWSTYDAMANAPFAKGGFEGIVYDGSRYVYFVANSETDTWSSAHGEVLRLDAKAPFSAPAAWSIYDYGEDPNGCALQSGCNDPDGYHDAVFDGRFVYFSPSYNGTTLHGEVLRYDTLTIDGSPIPAVGTWGMLVMLLLLMTGGTVMATRRRSRAI